jgi:YggT family protein
MGGYFTDAGLFLVTTLFEVYIFAVLLRFLLQWVRADFYNPIAHFIVVVTNPPLKPLRRVIPGLFGIDLASVVLVLLLEALYQSLVALFLGRALAPAPLAVLGLFHLLGVVLNLYFFGILIQVILSWVSPYPNALSQMLARLTEPLLRPARRLVPSFSGFDLSPMVVMIAIVLVQMALPYLQRGALELVG